MEIKIEKKTKIKSYYKMKKYDNVGDFYEGLARIKKDGDYGFINKKGEEVVELKYDDVGDFHEGLAWIKNYIYYGFINKEGKEVIKLNYDFVGDFHEGLARVKKDGYYGFINKEGKEIVKPKYDFVGDFYEGLAYVQKEGYYGFINKEGNEITDICFRSIRISDGVIIFNEEYIVSIENLKLIYVCLLKIKNDTRRMEFDSKEKRDGYLKVLSSYIEGREVRKESEVNDKKRELEPLIKKLEEDILSIENNYYQDVEKAIGYYYKSYKM